MVKIRRYRGADKKKRVIAIGVVIIIIYLFATSIGLSLLADASIFVGNLLAGKTAERENVNYLDTLTVDEPSQATPKAEILISGFAHGFSKLEFYLNEKKVHEKTIKNTENFSETVSGLREGDNEIYLIATAEGKEQKQSKIFTITYLAKKPDLEVTEPASGSTVRKEDLTVKGKTSPDNTVKVNGQPAIVDTTGAFEYTLRIKEGENKLQVVATDLAGNTTEAEVIVRYEKE